MKDLNENELRVIIEDAYKRAGRNTISSATLKMLINFLGHGQEWGNFVYLLTRKNIIKKEGNEKVKEGKGRYYIYRLVDSTKKIPLVTEPMEQQKKIDDEGVLLKFNEKTIGDITIGGNNADIKIIISALKEKFPTLKAYRSFED